MGTFTGTNTSEALFGTANADKIYGLGGMDTLRGAGGNDNLFGGANDDALYGGANNDTLQGEDGADYLDGGNGNDLLYGGTGNDGLIGGSGSDSIYGGLDGDLIYGGGGNDHFFYNAKEGAPVGDFEQIADFARGDKLHLEGIDAQESRAGDQAFTFIGNQPFSAAGQLHAYYDSANNWTVVEGNTDSDFAAEFQIILNSGYQIAAVDIVL